jgi:hypothetical protein
MRPENFVLLTAFVEYMAKHAKACAHFSDLSRQSVDSKSLDLNWQSYYEGDRSQDHTNKEDRNESDSNQTSLGMFGGRGFHKLQNRDHL